MGVAEQLGYRFAPVGPVRRILHRAAATRPLAWLTARLLSPLDTVAQRLTGGRHTLPHLVMGLPVLDLTTTGRRSGAPRTTHLIAIPLADDLALLGTNFGQPRTPAWVLNLEAEPDAVLAFRGRTVDVRARPADPTERAAVLDRAESLYVGYREYQKRITGRQIRVFVVEQVR